MINSSNPDDGELLNRANAQRQVAEKYAAHLNALAQLIDVGVRFLSVPPESHLDHHTEQVVFGAFWRRATVVLDTIETLLRAGQVQGSRSPLRTLIELRWQLEWLLERDTDVRAKRFAVSSIRSDRSVAKRALEHAVKRNESLRKAGLPTSNDPGRFWRNRLDGIERAINEDQTLAAIDAAFTAEKGKKKGDPYWFSLDGGPGSYFQLARQLGYEDVYFKDYGRYSEIVHSANLGWDLTAAEDGWDIQPIRDIETLPSVWYQAIEEGEAIFRALMEFSHPSDLESFEEFMYELQARIGELEMAELNEQEGS